MDKGWISMPKLDPKHIERWIDFLNFATNNQPNEGKVIACPCRKCKNVRRKTIKIVKGHLLANGFQASYTNWIFHGEASKHTAQQSDQRSKDRHDEMQEMLHDAFGIIPSSLVDEITNNTICHGPDEKTGNFFKLLKEAERELYPGCKGMSLLSFVIQLLHLKCLYGWSNESFNKLLNFFKKCLPEGKIVPKSFGASRKLLNGLDLDYHKVHACPRNCKLYWGENIDRVDCKVCKRPRYKQYEVEANESNIIRDKVPEKIVRYFPLITRLKRLFMSSKTASLMTWHADNPTPDGIMRHPVDSAAWKHIDHLYPNFSQEPRNIRLGLASDGFNPFRTMSISHSTWPVVLMTYNLPLWLCMKQPYMMLSLLIDGPKALGNDIDVYLSLIVDELKLLWDNGVQTYDAARDEIFQMRGMLLWTINDFPAYANLSGWSTKGHLACPCCHIKTHSRRLIHGKKYCYLGHRRWLDIEHKFQRDRLSFDGTMEFDSTPQRLSGEEVLAMFPPNYKNQYGIQEDVLQARKRKRTNYDVNEQDATQMHNWKKKSIFF